MSYKELISILNNLRIKRLEIERLKKKVIELGESLGYKSPSYDEKVQSLGSNNIAESEQYNYLASLQELKNQLATLEIEQAIWNKRFEELEDPNYRLILKLYYQDGMNLYRISGYMNYSYDYTRQLKARAMRKLFRSIEKK